MKQIVNPYAKVPSVGPTPLHQSEHRSVVSSPNVPAARPFTSSAFHATQSLRPCVAVTSTRPREAPPSLRPCVAVTSPRPREAPPSVHLSVAPSAPADVANTSCAESPTLSPRAIRSALQTTTQVFGGSDSPMAPTALRYGAKRNELPRSALDTVSSPPRTRRDTRSTPARASTSPKETTTGLDKCSTTLIFCVPLEIGIRNG